ncbi:MAG: glycosyltransferase [Gammaproteobacteria bacterium]|jgi:exo-beta-1,3-glucanase (GH17 family)/cellulose synthase/poly-beta-1,6-N-acetylglucosamine synthase-like glycosyltransferase
MTRINIIIAVAVAALSISIWAFVNQPETEPPWPPIIQGFSFSPMRAHHDPLVNALPTVEELDEDLALLEGKTHAVRTYTVESTLAEVPALARKHGLNVALGGWVDGRLEKNAMEIERLIKVANKNRRNVVRIIVGNEALLRRDLPVDQLISYITQVRRKTGKPVSTAEPWHVWTKYPELAEEVDYLAVHMLPYWEGIHLDIAVDYVIDRVNDLKRLYPDKPIVIAEVGWPSNGRTRQSAVASDENEAIFLRRFLDRAEQEDYVYYVMEAFDQPWKRKTEGAVGAYWGVFDVDRNPKFPFSEPIVRIPEWHVLAAISVVIAVVTFGLLLIDARTLTHHGRSFLAVVAYTAATAVVWTVYDYAHQYLTVSAVIVGVLMLIGMIGVLLVLLVEAHEWAEALWVRERRRTFLPVPVDDAALPMVSVHVPAHDEPPDMLIETLDALAKLDYPNYEVIVIDNNTRDPAIWKPVEAHCQRLGRRFHFYHVDPLAGFKSGALNYALSRTAPEAEIIGVIDSDYIVDRRWLRDLAPQFLQPGIAVVQAPQDYRDSTENAFKSMCYAEYRGFFYIGMVTRNERNAIIQHGTMTMVRRNTLQEVGNWSEWCITEDAELGLKIFARGYEASYIPKSYGRGLMPDSFHAYKNQRFRWAYGAMQIMRHYSGQLFGGAPSRLSTGQRYHFLAGWLPWMADGVNLLFNLAALSWSLGMILFPLYVDPPLIIFSLLPLALFSFKVAKVIYLYRGARIVGTVRQTLAAALAGLALSHTIARAMWAGLVTRHKPFLRTPKMERSAALFKAIGAAREETLLALALWLAAGAIAYQSGSETLDVLFWVIVLLVQSIPYCAALLVSVVSAVPALPARLVCGRACEESLKSTVASHEAQSGQVAGPASKQH